MYKVLFIGKVKDLNDEYEQYNRDLYASAETLDGFVSMESEVIEGVEITVSTWKTKEDVMQWARDPEHIKAKRKVNEWYDWYKAKHFEGLTNT
tara:strand:+ start:16991 stop:17269 length:279 start_codon:yes stop_codon:yes gene_type:complete